MKYAIIMGALLIAPLAHANEPTSLDQMFDPGLRRLQHSYERECEKINVEGFADYKHTAYCERKLIELQKLGTCPGGYVGSWAKQDKYDCN